jgi:hypothetical protein
MKNLIINFAVRMNTSRSVVVRAGNDVAIVCTVYGFPLNRTMDFHWSFQSVRIVNSTTLTISETYPSSNTRKISANIKNSTLEQNGTYLCHFGGLISNTELTVQSKARILVV